MVYDSVNMTVVGKRKQRLYVGIPGSFSALGALQLPWPPQTLAIAEGSSLPCMVPPLPLLVCGPANPLSWWMESSNIIRK